MNRFVENVDACVREVGWKDLALLKFCLCALGVLLGMAVPQKRRGPAALAALSVFAACYVPLMWKFFPLLCGDGGRGRARTRKPNAVGTGADESK